MEEWLYPRENQPIHGFFHEEDKEESTYIERLDKEGATIYYQNLDWAIYTQTMLVVKWSEKVKQFGYNIYDTLCFGLYKEE